MFYTFRQNNSGGIFVMDATTAHFMIFEADSADEANDRAERAGIYFNGCDDGIDCRCCGDRWYLVDEWEAAAEPMIYGVPVAEFAESVWTPENKAYAYVHYKDGSRKQYIQAHKG